MSSAQSGAAFDVPAEQVGLFDDVAKSFHGSLAAPRIESVDVLPDLMPDTSMTSRSSQTFSRPSWRSSHLGHRGYGSGGRGGRGGGGWGRSSYARR
eukprot:73801-Hanusia_phi.AAC.1